MATQFPLAYIVATYEDLSANGPRYFYLPQQCCFPPDWHFEKNRRWFFALLVSLIVIPHFAFIAGSADIYHQLWFIETDFWIPVRNQYHLFYGRIAALHPFIASPYT